MRRVLILGYDSLDFRYCDRWVGEGLLPTLARVKRKAHEIRVRNVGDLSIGGLWPCLHFGCNIDEHGQYDGFNKFDTDLYVRRRLRPEENEHPYFWERISEAGARIVVVDAPYVPPTPGIHGIQVVDWLTHVRTGPRRLVTVPPELAQTIARDYGAGPYHSVDHSCPGDMLEPRTVDTAKTLLAQQSDQIDLKTAFLRDTLARDDWDFGYAVFHEAHDIGHMAWLIHDEEHPEHDPEVRKAVGDPLATIYQRLDGSMGQLLEVLDDDTDVGIYMSHGIQRQVSGSYLLDRVLYRLECQYDPAFRRRDRWRYAKAALRGRRYRPLLEDRASRRFFEMTPNQAHGGIRFNVKGRERQGRVARGPEYDELCERLSEDLRQVVDARTGQPIISEIRRTESLYAGPKRDALPDLLLTWSGKQPITEVESPLIGRIERRAPPRSGDHYSLEGRFFWMAADRAPFPEDEVHLTELSPRLVELFRAR